MTHDVDTEVEALLYLLGGAVDVIVTTVDIDGSVRGRKLTPDVTALLVDFCRTVGARKSPDKFLETKTKRAAAVREASLPFFESAMSSIVTAWSEARISDSQFVSAMRRENVADPVPYLEVMRRGNEMDISDAVAIVQRAQNRSSFSERVEGVLAVSKKNRNPSDADAIRELFGVSTSRTDVGAAEQGRYGGNRFSKDYI